MHSLLCCPTTNLTRFRWKAVQTLRLFENPSTLIALGRLQVDRENKIVRAHNGDEISLTNAEYRLLDFFLDRPNEVIPRVVLLAEIGSDLTRYMDRTIDVLILRLRRKIEENPSKPVHLQTRRGQGYIFVTSPAAVGVLERGQSKKNPFQTFSIVWPLA